MRVFMEAFIICVDTVKWYLTLFSILIKIYDLFSCKFYILTYFWLFSPELFIFFWGKCSILALCFLIQYVLCRFYLLNLKSISNCIFLKTSEIESDDHWQREQELQRENLKLSSENIELKFQLEQANKDLPRLKVNLVFFITVRKSDAWKPFSSYLIVMITILVYEEVRNSYS